MMAVVTAHTHIFRPLSKYLIKIDAIYPAMLDAEKIRQYFFLDFYLYSAHFFYRARVWLVGGIGYTLSFILGFFFFWGIS